MTRFLAFAAVLGIVFPATAPAVDSAYHLNTPAPEGRAVCLIKGSLKKGPSTQIEVALSPSMGEARLDFAIGSKGRGAPTIIIGEAAAGTQAGCDILPNTPDTVQVPWVGLAAKFSGVLDVHAHPGSDCAAGGVAEGMVSLSSGATGGVKLGPVKCDGDTSHANLGIRPQPATTGTTGEILSESAQIENHGPGDATGTMLWAKIPKGLFLKGTSVTKGTCHFDFRKSMVRCDVGPLPAHAIAFVTLDAIPLKPGRLTTNFNVSADNGGKLLAAGDSVGADVAKGNNAILSLTLKCKGAAGTVTINPDGNGGMTTCTCPDPNDATRDTVTCIETYAQKTTVTLTPAATTGAFNKWTGACAGNPAACGVTLDPGAQNPDQSATAKFK